MVAKMLQMGHRKRQALLLAAGMLWGLFVLPGAGLPTSAITMAKPASASPLPDGSLVRARDALQVYLVWANRRHWIDSPPTFLALGYNSSQVRVLPPDQVNTVPNGNAIHLNTVAGGLVWPWAPIRPDSALLSLQQPSVTPGAVLTVKGSGFLPSETVTLKEPSGPALRVVASVHGAFTAKVPLVGSVGPGRHLVFAAGKQSGRLGVQVFHVIAPAAAPTLAITGNPVTRATKLGVSGAGFAPHEQVWIFFGAGVSSAVATAGSTGSFGPMMVSVPTSVSRGFNAVRAFGATSFRFAVRKVTVR